MILSFQLKSEHPTAVHADEHKNQHLLSPDTLTLQLKSWPRASLGDPTSPEIVKSNSTSATPVSTLPRSLSPTSPVQSLWMAKTIGMADSGDPYVNEVNGVPAERLLIWKLFGRLHQKSDIFLAEDIYLTMAQRLAEHLELEKAIHVMQTLPRPMWTLEVYKLLIFLRLSKRPKDVEAAQKLLQQYATGPVAV